MQKQIHSDPQDTTPQMTRLVILAITCLKVCCIEFARNYTVTQIASLCKLWGTWQDSNLHRGC